MPITQLPYPKDSADLFAHFAHLSYAIFLDSCHPHYKHSRFDILTADPFATITTENGISTIVQDDTVSLSKSDPFSLVKEHLAMMPKDLKQQLPELPFTTGALGYFGYDIGRLLETLPDNTIRDIAFPDACIGFYDWSIVVDHKHQVAWLVTQNALKYDQIQSLLSTTPQENSFYLTTSFQSNMSKDHYQQSFQKLQQHILQGDCYEANLCQRFTATYEGSPWQDYQKLRKINPSPF